MLSPGTIVERYQVADILGRGGVATVYRVKHTVLGTEHALKVLNTTQTKQRSNLIREGQLQARLDPEHIVPVHDVLFVDGSPALLMPIVQGCSLRDVLSRHQPTDAEIVYIFSGISQGIAVAHERGIVHRDLKPANVLLDIHRGKVRVRVADFGLGIVTGKQTTIRGFAGTLSYAAPEQLAGDYHPSPEADLWALGVMLFRCLTGRMPFVGKSTKEMLQSIQERPAVLGEVPVAWQPIIGSLLETDLSRRGPQAHALPAVFAGVAKPCSLSPTAPLTRNIRQLSIPLKSACLQDQDTGYDESFESSLRSNAQTIPIAPVHHLPKMRDAFIGRDRELEILHQSLLSSDRLLCLLGTAGIGKTRLAIQYARQHLTEWPGGVWFCDLTEARTLAAIHSAVARTLGVPLGDDDPTAQLGKNIASHGQMLLIIDNFEQVAEHARQTIGVWLNQTTEAVFLTTTRVVLELDSATNWVVPSLSNSHAREIFIKRAQEARASFHPTADDCLAIDALVSRLDNLPLAIELAAARIAMMSPQKMLSRIEDRFQLLTSRHSESARHRTLRNALDWSWALLAEWERSTLAQLSVFEGGFDLEAAEAVLDLTADDEAPSSIDAIHSMVDKSLVHTVADDRFKLLVSVQAYAAEKLKLTPMTEATEIRHGEHFASFGTEDALQELSRRGGAEVRQRLTREQDNLSAALHHAEQRADGRVAVCAVASLFALLEMIGPYSAGVTLAERAVNIPALSPRWQCRAVFNLGEALQLCGDTKRAILQYNRALEISRELNDKTWIAKVLNRISNHYFFEGNYRLSQDFIEQSNQISAALDDQWQLSIGRTMLGNVLLLEGKFSLAMDHLSSALALSREVDNRTSEASANNSLGYLHRTLDQPDEARRYYTQAFEIFKESGDLKNEGNMLINLGTVNRAVGKQPQALQNYEQALRIHRKLGNRRSEGIVLLSMALIYRELGSHAYAHKHFEQALVISREVGNRRSEGIIMGAIGHLYQNLAQPVLAQQHYAQALAISREISNRRGEGIILGNIATLHLEEGRLKLAQEGHTLALSIHKETRNRRCEGEALTMLGSIQLLLTNPERALKFYEDALHIHREISHRRGEGVILACVGDVHRHQGRLESALAHYQQALQIHRSVGNLQNEGLVLEKLGILHQRRGDDTASHRLLTQALQILREHENGYNIGTVLGALAKSNARQGRFKKAYDLLKEGSALLNKGIYKPKLLVFLAHSACTHHLMGHHAEAMKALNDATRLEQSIGDGRPYSTYELGIARELILSPSHKSCATPRGKGDIPR